MVDIAAKKAEGKGKGYEKWATLHNLKQMAATMSIYEESGFSSPEELEAALAAASAELNSVHAKLKAVESTLQEKKDLQKQLPCRSAEHTEGKFSFAELQTGCNVKIGFAGKGYDSDVMAFFDVGTKSAVYYRRK